ncbi:hypothetical protein [Leptolyngbya sp. O-77]|nr:hypothetical protein [Leptolyngbya sp. O-77]
MGILTYLLRQQQIRSGEFGDRQFSSTQHPALEPAPQHHPAAD